MSEENRPDDGLFAEVKQSAAGFLVHLEELRVRIIRALIIVAVGTAVCLVFSERLVTFLIDTAVESNSIRLALLAPAEGFLVHLKVSFVAGLFLTSPFWFGQLWGFVSPGLYKREKRVILPVVFLSSGVFLLGAAFGWKVLPYAAGYFASFASGQVETAWSLAAYVNFTLQFFLAFGLVFELPLVIYTAAMLGVVTPPQLRKYRRHAIIGILLTAGIITPPDVFSQVLIAAPLIVLYELGIVAAAVALKRRSKRAAV